MLDVGTYRLIAETVHACAQVRGRRNVAFCILKSAARHRQSPVALLARAEGDILKRIAKLAYE